MPKGYFFMYICNDCPRNCSIDRTKTTGFCACGINPCVTRAAPHFGEEPCISGTNGSGAIFFSGCNLKCSFCQNNEISSQQTGKELSSEELAVLMLRLQDKGVHNINLVTGSHHIRQIAKALELAKLSIPVVWNSSGYEKVDSLKLLDGLIQVYMPDYKYASKNLAKKYSFAVDYPEIVQLAINEMFRQRGNYILKDDLLISGVLIRHLILPGFTENTMDVIDSVADTYSQENVLFSLMCQFTPMPKCDIKNKVTSEENSNMIHYMKSRKLVGFSQELSSADEQFIPKFDLTGVN